MVLAAPATARLAGLPKCFQLLNDPDAAAGGDYKFDPLGFGGGATGDLAEKELANGRAAILGFSGIVTQSALTGNGFPCAARHLTRAPGARMRMHMRLATHPRALVPARRSDVPARPCAGTRTMAWWT